MSSVVGSPTGEAPVALELRRPKPLSRVLAIFAHGFRGHLRGILTWGVAFGLLGALYVALWPAFESSFSELFSAMPEGYMDFLGISGGITTVEGFLSIELFDLLAPLALPFFTIVIGARTIAGDEERQSLDVMLSNPISRWELVVGRFLLMAAGLAVILAIMTVLTWLPAPLMGVDLSITSVLEGSASLWVFCLLFGGLSLLCSALVRKNSVAIAIPVAVLVASYVGNALANVISSIDTVRYGSIFHYYGSPLTEGIQWVGFLGILGVAVVLTALAAAAFSRRDILS
jgi:ABC-2 type transport system permease protein